ncbi:hypothetical protein L2E82_24713 [Cichorium intybus]|uniref:Uncharacterized protein n=1 Tax=Cichorium intybus TaxID=13427 RepID=A0ACB9E126_CICIN|nr:hypothetical protein L2E82_24713 [Cichorium intybus]
MPLKSYGGPIFILVETRGSAARPSSSHDAAPYPDPVISGFEIQKRRFYLFGTLASLTLKLVALILASGNFNTRLKLEKRRIPPGPTLAALTRRVSGANFSWKEQSQAVTVVLSMVKQPMIGILA